MHTKQCLARSVISAIENARDNEDFEDEDFLRFVTRETELREDGETPSVYSSTPYSWAIEYLTSSLSTCLCYPERGAFYLDYREYEDMTDAGRAQHSLNKARAVEKMVAKGFTIESALSHLEGMCDQLYCGACNAGR